MRNKKGITANERLNRDIEFAATVKNAEQRYSLLKMALATAEFAVDFGLITYKEWNDHTNKAFALM